jgi:transposase
MYFYMTRGLLKPNPKNASIHELKELARVGSSETSLRCTAIQMLIVGVTRETSHSDSETFQAFLDEAAKFINFQRPCNILVVDNASWHRRKTLKWHGWEPMYLPPYSPDLNPIERIWLVMKAQWFNNYICQNIDQLIERLDQALLNVINNPKQTKKTAAIGTLF